MHDNNNNNNNSTPCCIFVCNCSFVLTSPARLPPPATLRSLDNVRMRASWHQQRVAIVAAQAIPKLGLRRSDLSIIGKLSGISIT